MNDEPNVSDPETPGTASTSSAVSDAETTGEQDVVAFAAMSDPETPGTSAAGTSDPETPGN